MKPDHSALSRRRFMGQANCALISAIPVLNTLLNLRLAGTVAAQGQGTGYRALVCLFASGGNDTFNVLSPYSGPSSTAANSFTEYTAARSNLALTHAQQIEITPDNTPGRTFGVHSAMPKLAALFAQQKAAFVANVGTLVEPVFNRTQVAQSTKRLPLGLYSHSDQTEQWQTSVPHSRAGVGWAGRMMDLIKSFNAEQRVSMNISMDGSNVWQTGVTARSMLFRRAMTSRRVVPWVSRATAPATIPARSTTPPARRWTASSPPPIKTFSSKPSSKNAAKPRTLTPSIPPPPEARCRALSFFPTPSSDAS
jgi:uncharacterized protein (DUF1501 family)